MTEPRQDLVKLREWEDVDPDVHRRESWDATAWAWPAPPVTIESRIDGRLRAEILQRIGRPADDAGELRLLERNVEGGFSEFTVETDYELEVWIHDGDQAQQLWATDAFSEESALAAFLGWVTGGDRGAAAAPRLLPVEVQQRIVDLVTPAFIGDRLRGRD